MSRRRGTGAGADTANHQGRFWWRQRERERRKEFQAYLKEKTERELNWVAEHMYTSTIFPEPDGASDDPTYIRYVPKSPHALVVVMDLPYLLVPRDSWEFQGGGAFVDTFNSVWGGLPCEAATDADTCSGMNSGGDSDTLGVQRCQWAGIPGIRKCQLNPVFFDNFVSRLSERVSSENIKERIISNLPIRGALLEAAKYLQSGMAMMCAEALVVWFQEHYITYGDMLAALYGIWRLVQTHSRHEVEVNLLSYLWVIPSQREPLAYHLRSIEKILRTPERPLSKFSWSKALQTAALIMIPLASYLGSAAAAAATPVNQIGMQVNGTDVAVVSARNLTEVIHEAPGAMIIAANRSIAYDDVTGQFVHTGQNLDTVKDLFLVYDMLSTYTPDRMKELIKLKFDNSGPTGQITDDQMIFELDQFKEAMKNELIRRSIDCSYIEPAACSAHIYNAHARTAINFYKQKAPEDLGMETNLYAAHALAGVIREMPILHLKYLFTLGGSSDVIINAAADATNHLLSTMAYTGLNLSNELVKIGMEVNGDPRRRDTSSMGKFIHNNQQSAKSAFEEEITNFVHQIRTLPNGDELLTAARNVYNFQDDKKLITTMIEQTAYFQPISSVDKVRNAKLYISANAEQRGRIAEIFYKLHLFRRMNGVFSGVKIALGNQQATINSDFQSIFDSQTLADKGISSIPEPTEERKLQLLNEARQQASFAATTADYLRENQNWIYAFLGKFEERFGFWELAKVVKDWAFQICAGVLATLKVILEVKRYFWPGKRAAAAAAAGAEAVPAQAQAQAQSDTPIYNIIHKSSRSRDANSFIGKCVIDNDGNVVLLNDINRKLRYNSEDVFETNPDGSYKIYGYVPFPGKHLPPKGETPAGVGTATARRGTQIRPSPFKNVY